mgnify:CR=1 FL=1
MIRGKDGDIYFLSMAVDCRDGFKGDISHSFEPGDTTHYGFIRDYTKDPNKIAFYIGNLDAENAVRVMEILTNKLNEHEGASAIIVSHDMHLAVTFADFTAKLTDLFSTSSCKYWMTVA